MTETEEGNTAKKIISSIVSWDRKEHIIAYVLS